MTATETEANRADGPAVVLVVEPVLVGAEAAGLACGVSGRTWRRWHLQGLVPAPLRVGTRVRWNLAELRLWAAAGAPPRRRWEAEAAGREGVPGDHLGRLRQLQANGQGGEL